MYEKGQVWFLKRPGTQCITKALITDVTKRTIEIKDLHSLQRERYNFGQLDFIELVEEAQ